MGPGYYGHMIHELLHVNGSGYTTAADGSYKSPETFYNDITKIAKNTKPFDAVYNKHFLKGDTIYLDVNNDFVKANNTHFVIDVIKKN